ncbi:F-box/WD repeat-containing protein [Criblamydia sequanensis]|uniref:F-box and WD repeat-containing protein n=1 Tax=Candidatus Criblamydia sequanensis CRIB-18 TaxID=1437425 RepID=A0A090D1H8_9BACT|nr:F-box/WD40 repeat-containing protein [Criblamydia sequanensis]CDR33558.1 F-box and WD repeat-containing protein [Criblamydia sequanensis CRIB-18]
MQEADFRESSLTTTNFVTQIETEPDRTAWLPDETLLYILSFLPDLSTRTISKLVCKRWEQIASDPSLFQASLFKKEYPSSAVHLDCDKKLQESYQYAKLIERRIKDSSFKPHVQLSEVQGMITIGKGQKGRFFYSLPSDSENIGGVQMWNTFDKEAIGQFTIDEDVWIHCFREHEGHLYAGGSNGFLFKWEMEGNSCENDVSVISHRWNITSLVWADNHLFSSSLDKTIKEYDKDLNVIKTYAVHETPVTCFVYDNGKFFSASREDCKLHIWEKDSSEQGWKLLHTLSTKFSVTDIQPFDDKLYYSEGSTIHILDLKTFTEIQSFETHFVYNENMVVFDRFLFVSGSTDQKLNDRKYEKHIKVWDIEALPKQGSTQEEAKPLRVILGGKEASHFIVYPGMVWVKGAKGLYFYNFNEEQSK